MELYLHKYIKSSGALGYGKRFVIWTQGCKKRCFNCYTPDAQSLTSGGFYISVDNLLEIILSVSEINGVTITGGEPFLQAHTLGTLIMKIKAERPEFDFLVYTGYKYNFLYSNMKYWNLLKNIDLLIDGEYKFELAADHPLIGSINQEINIISDKGETLAHDIKNIENNNLELHINFHSKIFMVGIPSKLQNYTLKNLELKIFNGDD